VDYVVFGMGYGATLMLLGWVLRTFGPGFRYRADDDAPPLSGKQMMARASWRRFAAGLGSVVATAGMALVFITLALILAHPSNSVGVLTVLLVVGAIVIGVATWLWLYAGRYGTHGLVPERTAPAPAPQAAARPVVPAKTARAVPVATPGPAVAEGDDANEQVAAVAAPVDPYAFGPMHLDEDDLAQAEIRMSRYHVHHPEPESGEVVDGSPLTDGDDGQDVGDTHVLTGEDAPDDIATESAPELAGQVRDGTSENAHTLDDADGALDPAIDQDTVPSAGEDADPLGELGEVAVEEPEPGAGSSEHGPDEPDDDGAGPAQRP
jgi:hypothetical protein